MKIAFVTASLAALGSATWFAGTELESEPIAERHGRLLELPPVTSTPISGDSVFQKEKGA